MMSKIYGLQNIKEDSQIEFWQIELRKILLRQDGTTIRLNLDSIVLRNSLSATLLYSNMALFRHAFTQKWREFDAINLIQ